MNRSTKDRLTLAFQLPGFEDWRSPVDVPNLNRPMTRPEALPGKGRVAAVLLLLYPDQPSNQLGQSSRPDDRFGLNLVLTKRNSELSNHAGQISFPGGGQESGESLWQTACREAFEEIGVGKSPADNQGEPIELIGQLNTVYIPPSDFTVTPFVGWQDSRPEFVCAVEEVEQVIEVSLADLLDPRFLKHGEVVSANSQPLEVPYYQAGDHRVWGATAIILSELIERVDRAS